VPNPITMLCLMKYSKYKNGFRGNPWISWKSIPDFVEIHSESNSLM